MRHRARGGNAVIPVADGAGGGGTAADKGGTRAERGTVCPLRAARTEFGHRAPVCRAHDAVRLGGDQGLVVQRQQDVGLDELRFDGGSAYRQDRFSRKDRRPLRHGVNVAGKAEVAQIGEEGLVKAMLGAQKGNILFGEMQILDIGDHLLQPGGDGKTAPVRDLSEENVKIGDLVRFAQHVIAVGHRQLVKIAEHGVVLIFHKRLLFVSRRGIPLPGSGSCRAV